MHRYEEATLIGARNRDQAHARLQNEKSSIRRELRSHEWDDEYTAPRILRDSKSFALVSVEGRQSPALMSISCLHPMRSTNEVPYRTHVRD